VIVVCGNAGSGKTTYGKRLAAELGAALVDIDACTERLARLVLRQSGMNEADRDSPEYKALLREPIYEAMFDIAVTNVSHVPCVLVGPFTTERRRRTWPAELEARLGVPVRIVLVHCDEPERRRRFAQRAHPRDEGKLDEWESFAAYGRDAAPPPFEHELVDTTHEPAP